MPTPTPPTGPVAPPSPPALPAQPGHRQRLRPLLLALTVIGLAVPWYFNLQYFAGGGSVAPEVFFRDALANPLTSAITLDVYLAALAFCVGVTLDRDAGSRRWWAWPATFLIGLSFALPGYLWWRLGRPDLKT
jgi:Terpene cyclase DEP1